MVILWLYYGYTMLTNGRYIPTYQNPMVRPIKVILHPRRAQLRTPLPRVPRVPRSIFCRSFEPCWKRTCPIACWEMIPDTESCWRMSWNRSAWKTSRSLLDIDQLPKHGKPPKKRPDDCCFSLFFQTIAIGLSHTGWGFTWKNRFHFCKWLHLIRCSGLRRPIPARDRKYEISLKSFYFLGDLP